MAYTILQVPGDGEVIGLGFLTRIRDNQEFFNNRPGVGNHFQRFTSSGTWTKPADATWVYVQVIGGGGRGVEVASAAWSGGEGGHVSVGLMRAVDIADSISVTVGSGVSVGGSEPSGGDSSFGTYVAKGGVNGQAGISGGTLRLTARPGQGGTNYSGAAGQGQPGIGGGVYAMGGANGESSLVSTGGGGGGRGAASPGGNGGIPGGGGGSVRGSGLNFTPGSGARGEVRVYAW